MGECECEVFARWLVGDSEVAEKVRRAAIELKWPELGPLLTYNATEGDDEGFNYDRYLYAAKGAYKLTKFTLQGTWATTKMVGRVALPETRVALKTTGLVAGAADMGLEAFERKVAAVDPANVRALVEWLNEELAIVGAMATVVLNNANLDKMLGEIGIGEDTGDVDLGDFAAWLNGDSGYATQILDAVDAKKVDAEATDGK